MDQAQTISDGTVREIVIPSETEAEIGVSSRANFTLAHELGHALMHQSSRAMSRSLTGRNYRAQAGTRGTGAQEEEANYFAGAFLMPREAVDASATIDRLCAKFGVATKTAELRVRAVKQLSEPPFEKRLSEKTLALMEKMGIDVSKFRNPTPKKK
jgi:Zn-dependent peptidase ImmA (M78 family)